MSDLPHKSNKTMDNSGCPSSGCQSGSLRGLEDPSPVPPRRTASVPASVFLEMLSFPVVPRGGSLSIDPRQALFGSTSSAPAVACAPPTIEVTLILAPLQKSAPQRIDNRSTAVICASIDTAALADSGNDDDNNDYDKDVEYSLFGKAPIPSRKPGEGQGNDDDNGLPPFDN
jgi:hypothetical protein